MKSFLNSLAMAEKEREDAEQKMERDGFLTEYLNNSSIHGLAKIAQAKNFYVKFIWIVIFLAFFCASIYSCYALLYEYFQYEAYLVYKNHNVKSLTFPSITLCNANNFQASKINQNFDSDSFLKNIINKSLEYGILLPVAQYAGIWALDANNVTVMKEKRAGSDMLIPNDFDGWCVFQTFKNCSKRDFVNSFYHSYKGLCKTFNNDGKYVQIGSGPESGLSLKLFINQKDYARLIPFDLGAGVQLIVHPNGVFPDTMIEGVLLAPGTLTRISLNRQIVKRLSDPYPSKCVHKNGTDFFPGPYTVANCKHSCLHRDMYKKCGVVEAVVKYNLDKKGMKVPFAMDKTPSKDPQTCLLDFYNSALSGEIQCECQLPCEEEKFLVKSSSSKWPSKADLSYYRPVLAKIFNKTEVSEEFVYENMLAVQVFFDSLSYDEIIEVAAISDASIFGSIGGAVGLFIGASCFSIVEFFAFVIITIYNRFKVRIKPLHQDKK